VPVPGEHDKEFRAVRLCPISFVKLFPSFVSKPALPYFICLIFDDSIISHKTLNEIEAYKKLTEVLISIIYYRKLVGNFFTSKKFGVEDKPWQRSGFIL
jgi:hypothetical protein